MAGNWRRAALPRLSGAGKRLGQSWSSAGECGGEAQRQPGDGPACLPAPARVSPAAASSPARRPRRPSSASSRTKERARPPEQKEMPRAPCAPLLLLLLLLPPRPGAPLAPPRTPDQPPGGSLKHSSWKEQDPQGFSSIITMDTLKDFSGAARGQASRWNPPRCGVPDLPTLPGNPMGRNRQKRFVLSGGRWEKTDFTYKIARFPWQLGKAKVRRAIAAALRVWSDVTPLTFTEVQEGQTDIVVDFTWYWHGDNLPFDGPGGILAHAFFPKTHREGQVHLDYDETWSIGNDVGTDLLQVAAHEFGHILGLQHTATSKSLMSPFYFFRYPLKLSEDDKQGIQYLYGKPKSKTKNHPTQEEELRPPDIETNEITNGQPSLPPDACETDFDAVSMIRGELFFFKSYYVWRLRSGQLQAGYPALASRHWREIPPSVDAAFEDSFGNIWFFQGAQYWIYDGERRISGPLPTTELGFSASPIQAALMWGTEKYKIYFFKGGSYWRFNPSTHQVDNIYPRRMADWRGVPQEIDAAFQDESGFAYFLKGQQYWKFDPTQVKVLEGYPRLIGQDFFSCAPPSDVFQRGD
ncbi:stromelysin-3 [Tiliqua scincoides]|uniref:stromelysin-3 n=1 Tax=Tiliqua scincoides TaxID=71010 RepID=UPI003463731C